MKLRNKLTAGLITAGLALGLATVAYANRGNGVLGSVYVTSQGLYYDTFVSAKKLPNKGPFQYLDAQNGVTEFGPGDPGYLGGRWWIDTDGNGERDDTDTYLLCPLLPPGVPPAP
ncbi:MAG: hypothetical protein KDM81_18345 [Verrucomicrobiae bacterium]|nr:hypothetical protein [Verrucomicrobiae bacterium]MCP5523641.1 hypothetical protein [Verrucomicrobiales bacterium]